MALKKNQKSMIISYGKPIKEDRINQILKFRVGSFEKKKLIEIKYVSNVNEFRILLSNLENIMIESDSSLLIIDSVGQITSEFVQDEGDIDRFGKFDFLRE